VKFFLDLVKKNVHFVFRLFNVRNLMFGVQDFFLFDCLLFYGLKHHEHLVG
jgi:hypothetical protein